ncbi:hypothetical protein QUF49_09395 [Fictibacillus sp. b24]|uniref:hypothetical protein n=1 Tax=Fictibacillus sp. b24 TaxID=3055863 RepID=UPI0025A01FF6|nr:hypothetical protein [Fictibacillus sp. b24]MDM5316206.1 hypothetical protein [Fictibacillus sp. b24]
MDFRVSGGHAGSTGENDYFTGGHGECTGGIDYFTGGHSTFIGERVIDRRTRTVKSVDR